VKPQGNRAHEPANELTERQLSTLQAYHDGELSAFARWRFERALSRSPTLRRELEQLQKLSGWMDDLERETPKESVSDLWSEIGPALSRIDAEVGSAREAGRERAGWGWRPLAATGAVAAAALALFVLDNGSGIPEDRVAVDVPRMAHGSLRYLKTEGVSYVVSQESDDVTIIWLMDRPADNGA